MAIIFRHPEFCNLFFWFKLRFRHNVHVIASIVPFSVGSVRVSGTSAITNKNEMCFLKRYGLLWFWIYSDGVGGCYNLRFEDGSRILVESFFHCF